MTTAATRSPAHGRGIGRCAAQCTAAASVQNALDEAAHTITEKDAMISFVDDQVRLRMRAAECAAAARHTRFAIARSCGSTATRATARRGCAQLRQIKDSFRGKERKLAAEKASASCVLAHARSATEAEPGGAMPATCRACRACRARTRQHAACCMLSAASAARSMLHVVCWMVSVAFVARCMLQEHLEKRLESAINDVEMVCLCRRCRVHHAIRTATCTIMRHMTCTTTDATWLAEVAATRRTRLQLRAALGCNNETHSVARHFPPILQARERAVAEQRGHAQSLETELVATRRKLSVRAHCGLHALRTLVHRRATCCTVEQHVAPSCNMLHRRATSPCCTVLALSCNMSAT